MIENLSSKSRKLIGIWLLIGCLMVLVQIILGGVTRLTGSGLSITKWEIVTGTLPPMNAESWNDAFDLYKDKPQYKLINSTMSLEEFKFIYFWEYIHRLWARLMGFVFAIPFFFFIVKKMIPSRLLYHLLVVVGLAALAASVGWVMVASGLEDKPWVDPFKLTAHLSIAFILFSYLVWLVLLVTRRQQHFIMSTSIIRTLGMAILVVVSIQILLGGMMSGMKAGLNFPTWPSMNGEWIPSGLWTAENVVAEFFSGAPSLFMVTFVQFFHRLVAYLLLLLVIVFFIKGIGKVQDRILRIGFFVLIGMVFLQAILGILTVINCKGNIPLDLGVYHQAGAVLLLGTIVFINFHLIYNKKPI